MRAIPLIVLSLLASPAAAEVVSAGPNGFHVRQSVQIVIPTDAAYAGFGRVADWWNKGHTYSGDSGNLSMALSPGGCFCERLPNGGGIEHMRVAYLDPGKRVVLTGSLGPLLYEATTGVMDVKVKRAAGGSQFVLDYKVAGFANGGGDKLATAVDEVLTEQIKRFRAYVTARPQVG